MPKYEITSPEGQKFEVTAPDGASQYDVLSYAKRQFAASSSEQASPSQPTMGERLAGSGQGRLAMSAAAPFIKAAQAGANVGDWINEAVGKKQYNPFLAFGDPSYHAVPGASPMEGGAVGGYINQKLAELEQMKSRGQAYHETGDVNAEPGHDVMGLLGSLIPAGFIAKNVASRLPDVAQKVGASGILARIGIGAAQGGGIGASQPVTNAEPGESILPQTLRNTYVGVAAGGATPALGSVIRKIGEIGHRAIEPMYASGRSAILQRLREHLMGNNPQTIDAVRQATAAPQQIIPGVQPTVGEAIAHIPEATGIAAHQEAISKLGGLSPLFQANKADQTARIADLLVPIARNPGALDGDKAVRNTITGTMREKTLGQANTAAQLMPDIRTSLQQNQDKLKSALLRQQDLAQPAPSVNQDALRSAVDIHAPGPTAVPLDTQSSLLEKRLLPEQMQRYQTGMQQAKQSLADLESQGLRELKVQPIVKHIKATLNDPKLGSSEVVQKSLNHIHERLNDLAGPTGIIDADALYMVHKEAGNTIKKYADETKNFDQRLTAGLENRVQDSIDRAIMRAGGKNWPEYLAKHTELSRGINQMEAGQTLQDALIAPLGTSQRGAVFANALRQVEPGIFTDKQSGSLKQIADELARTDAFHRLAKGTTIPGGEPIPGQLGLPLPPFLNREIMAAKFLMGMVGKSAEGEIGKEAAAQYLNPKAFSESLAKVPPRYKPMLDALLQQLPAAAATGATRNF